MASTIVTKNSSTASAVPLTGDLTQGELAVNVTDKRLFTKNSGGTVVELGTNPASLALPNGTANGVAYLNGSKVVTTGTALTFDGTTFQYTGAANFATSTGNVGIGTSSPLGTLGIAGSATTTIVIPRSSNGTTATPVETQLIGSAFTNGTYPAGIYALNSFTNNSGNWLTFKTTDTGNTTATRMTLDSSGNLGLGVTPSAWYAGSNVYRGLQVGFGGVVYARGTTSQTGLASNFYVNTSGTDSRINAGYATKYEQLDGAHTWFTASSSTAGSAISFTQAMTLDASGDLQIGTTTSASRAITVGGSKNSIAIANANGGIYFGAGGTPTGNGGFGVNAAIARAEASNYHIAGSAAGDLCIAAEGTKAILFGTSASASSTSERARIDSSGNLLVATTSTGVASGGVSIQPAAGQTYIAIGHITGTSSGSYYMPFYYNGSIIGGITQNGTTAVAYNTSSDYRLKEDVQPMTGALTKVTALKPCTYKWKVDGSDGEGFIAHELAEVCPHAVTGEKDAVDAEGNPVYQGIDTSFLVATLTAAIQEQQAMIASQSELITQLTERITALEGK